MITRKGLTELRRCIVEADNLLGILDANNTDPDVYRAAATMRADIVRQIGGTVCRNPALLDAAERGLDDGWRDISTAPKDGSWLLGWHSSWESVTMIRWQHERPAEPGYFPVEAGWRTCAGTKPAVAPSHWRPLPAPPEANR